jgi:hypothetical protein
MLHDEPGCDAADRDGVRRVATAVVDEVFTWQDRGTRAEALLALLDHAEPLADDHTLAALTRLQYRTHAYALAAVLMLSDDPRSGDLATALVELLTG